MTSSSAAPAPTTTGPLTPSGPILPGGTGNIAALAAAGDLASDGLIDLYGQGVPEGGESADPAATANLCGYLFGTPDEIVKIARLTGDITLDPISGRHPAGPTGETTSGPTTGPTTGSTTGPTAQPTANADSSGATGATSVTASADAAEPILIACVYRSDGAPVLVLQIGDGPPIDPDLPGSPIIVDGSDGLHAVLSYSPHHQGAAIAPTVARDWLSFVIGRVAPIGTGAR